MKAEAARDAIALALDALPARDLEVEVRVLGGRWQHAELRHNAIASHRDRLHHRLHIRLARKHKRAWRSVQGWTSNLLSDAITTLAHRLRDSLTLAPEDPTFTPRPTPSDAGSPDTLEGTDQFLAVTGPVMRVNELAWFEIMASRHDVHTDGRYSIAQGAVSHEGRPEILAVGNHHGMFAHHVGSRCALDARFVLGDVSLRMFADGYRRSQVSGQQLAYEGIGLINRVRKGREQMEAPVDPRPGQHVVVLTEHAVAQLLWPMMPAFGAASGSPVVDNLGKGLWDSSLSLRCDVAHRALRTRPFDDEGVATQTVELVRGGYVSGLVYSRDSARAAGVDPTGHSVQVGSQWREQVRAPVLESEIEGVSLETLFDEVESGYLITHFASVRVPDMRTLEVQGEIGVGCFEIEHGDLVKGVKPARFRMSLVELLYQIEGVGTPRRALDMVVPALRIGGMTIEAKP